MPRTRQTRMKAPAVKRAKTAEPRAGAHHAEELMALAVDGAQSRHLPDYLKKFTDRAARMLGASWGAVAVFRGHRAELHAMETKDAAPISNEWLQAAIAERVQQAE